MGEYKPKEGWESVYKENRVCSFNDMVVPEPTDKEEMRPDSIDKELEEQEKQRKEEQAMANAFEGVALLEVTLYNPDEETYKITEMLKQKVPVKEVKEGLRWMDELNQRKLYHY